MQTKIPSDMLERARQAMTQSYSPYSNFPVGACIKTTTGKLFSGCNVENAAYNLCCCAEASAITTMVTAGERKIESIVVVTPTKNPTPPCGACRQRIAEFATATTKVYLCDKHDNQQTFTLQELLPHAFTPNNLEQS